MEIINRIRLKIGGSSYTISTAEPEEYVSELAQKINRSIDGVLGHHPALSVNDALVLTLLDYADAKEKSERSTDHIREQLTEYMSDAAKARMEADELRAEVARLKRELKLAQKGTAANTKPEGRHKPENPKGEQQDPGA